MSAVATNIDETSTTDATRRSEEVEHIGAVTVIYTNYRGETALRTIVPRRIWFGSTEWHPQAGWLLEAFDLEKQAERSFAMKDIRVWLPELK
jgi:hypothetical protein